MERNPRTTRKKKIKHKTSALSDKVQDSTPAIVKRYWFCETSTQETSSLVLDETTGEKWGLRTEDPSQVLRRTVSNQSSVYTRRVSFQEGHWPATPTHDRQWGRGTWSQTSLRRHCSCLSVRDHGGQLRGLRGRREHN